MAEELPQPSTSNPRPDYSWVADEPMNTVSMYAERWNDIPEEMFTDISASEDFEIRIPGLTRRICTVWGGALSQCMRSHFSRWATGCH
ncbi:hypothetical protein A2U01_0079935, partial [Trifolium medium]|nr:hypothetical protein [Trifolium medium]